MPKLLVEDVLKKLAPDITLDDGLAIHEKLDSFSLIQLLVLLQETFEISIAAEDFNPENFESIDSIEKMINRYYKV